MTLSSAGGRRDSSHRGVSGDTVPGRWQDTEVRAPYFTSGELHPGEISIECSRAGTAAAALWTTLRALPLTPDGLGLELRAAALELADALRDKPALALVVESELDIVCPFRRAHSASEIRAATETAFAGLAQSGWHLAKLRVDTGWLRRRHPWIESDAPHVTVLRSCPMKRAHAAVADELADALRAVLGVS